MKKLLLILLLIPFGLAAQVYTPPVNASLFSGLDSSNFVVTFNRNQTILGTKSFSDPTIFNDDLTVTGNIGLIGNIDATTITVGGSYTFPSSDGTADYIMKTNGSGTLSFIANPAFTGAVGFDATNISAVRIFRASDTITESWGHSHNEYKLLDDVYGAMGFADSSEVLTMTQNVHALITGNVGDLYIVGVNSGLTFVGDSIQVPSTGNYDINWDLSFSGANTDEYHIDIHINGVSQDGKGESERDMTGSSLGSASGHTILALTALDWITLQIENVNNNNDATVYASNVVVCKK